MSLPLSTPNPEIDFPGGTSGKGPTANAGDVRDVGLIPGSGRSLGGESMAATPVF